MGLQGVFVFQILNIEQYTESRKKEIFHVSFFSFKNATEDTDTISSL